MKHLYIYSSAILLGIWVMNVPPNTAHADWCEGPENNDVCTVRGTTTPHTERNTGNRGSGSGSDTRPGSGGEPPSARGSGGDGGERFKSIRTCMLEKVAEAQIDLQARNFRDELVEGFRNGTFDRSLEYGRLIVEYNRRTYMLPIVTDNHPSQISFHTFTNGPTGLAANGLSFVHVIGVIHNHPAETNTANLPDEAVGIANALQRGPSVGDMGFAETVSSFGGGQSVTTYIIAPDDKLYEYQGFTQPDWQKQGYTDDQLQDIEDATRPHNADANGEC